MAKDVDLSSKEWTDLVFQGKNKEFGAYTLRSASVKRHTKAVLYVVVALAVIMAIVWAKNAKLFGDEEADTNAGVEQQNVNLSTEDFEDEIIEDIILNEPEPEPEIIPEEETTATQSATTLLLVDEVNKEKEIKKADDIMENAATIGAKDVDGALDLEKAAVIDKVVEEKPKEVAKPKEEGPVNMAMVEQKPEFPGGTAAMYKWLGDNINYPTAAAEDGVQGKVTVAFVVEKDGRITNVQVVRGKHPALDKEAMRVVKAMPKWTPGRNNGQPVRVIYNLPVTFKLQ